MTTLNNNSPCAACKIQRRKCTQECIFAPYFPPDNPQKFAYVHKVFGASNVAKLLNEVNVTQREDAVKSLAYEAEARLRDPVYGCVGLITQLNNKLKNLQNELVLAKKELASYIGPQVMLPYAPPPSSMMIPTAVANGSSSSCFSYGDNSFFRFQMHHPFQNQLMISSSEAQTQNPCFAKKVLKSERGELE